MSNTKDDTNPSTVSDSAQSKCSTVFLDDETRAQILMDAEAEIKSVIKKHGVYFDITDGVLFLNHVQEYPNGDISVRAASFS